VGTRAQNRGKTGPSRPPTGPEDLENFKKKQKRDVNFGALRPKRTRRLLLANPRRRWEKKLEKKEDEVLKKPRATWGRGAKKGPRGLGYGGGAKPDGNLKVKKNKRPVAEQQKGKLSSKKAHYTGNSTLADQRESTYHATNQFGPGRGLFKG